MLRIILLSGGSGRRLWPVSNDIVSKQFIRILPSKLKPVSMVQRVWSQLTDAGLSSSAFIAAGGSQTETLRSQLGTSVRLIEEPSRRDTFAAIALACSYLLTEDKMNPEDTVIVIPVDPFVEISYFENLKTLDYLIQSNVASIALMGIKPDHPSSSFGYIVPESINNDYFTVKGFREKPTQTDAAKLINDGALWNSGVFAFKLKYILNKIQEMQLPTNYLELKSSFELLPKISFDYEVVEKEKNIVSITYNGLWKDLGTWESLSQQIPDQTGHAIITEDCSNTTVINHSGIPIIIKGINDALIAASPDGILVSTKADSVHIKPIVDRISSDPRHLEKEWGIHRCLTRNSQSETGILSITKGQTANLSYNSFARLTILSGNGTETGRSIKSGHSEQLTIGSIFSYTATESTEILYALIHGAK